MEKYKLSFDQIMQLVTAFLRNDAEADIRKLAASLGGRGDIVIELDSSARGRARLSILGSEADIEELCVRFCSYQSSALPISSFVRLVAKSSLRKNSLPSNASITPISVEVLFGIAVGELITRLDGDIAGDWISYGRLSRTFSYCYAQFNCQHHELSLDEVWNRWRDTRKMLGNEDSIELENEIFACIGLIEQATRFRNSKTNNMLFDVLADENPTAEIIHQLTQRLPQVQPYLLGFDGAIENRLMGFDKCVQAIQKLKSDAIEKSIFVAALANKILPGSGGYFHLLSPLAQHFPGLFLWYGYLSAHEGGRKFTERFSSIFRKFVDAIEISNSDASIKTNVDYCELQVMFRAREVDALRRVAEGSFVVIDLDHGLLAQVPFAARSEGKSGLEAVDLVPRSHVEKLLGEVERVLKFGAQLGYGVLPQNSDPESKPKSRAAKSQRNKAKSTKEAADLF
jgi:hypothetical protein